MLISVIGKVARRRLTFRGHQEDGFTLIEILVALAIMSIVLSVALLNIPNHDERYWRNDLDHLVASLNAAQDESLISGNVMLVQIDSVGWRFYQNSSTSMSGLSLGLVALDSRSTGSVLMPDTYRSQQWNKAVTIEPMQFTLGGEFVMGVLNIPVAQDRRQASILRNRNGRFTWVKR